MKRKIRIVLADDHALLRKGIRSILSERPEFRIIGEAKDGLDAIRLSKKLKPDMIIMDLSMPRLSGKSAIRTIKSRNGNIKVLVLTVHKAQEYVFEAFAAGADGYCLKDDNMSELIKAVEAVSSAKRYVSPSIQDIHSSHPFISF
jgi:two-component system, NarL family, response regulator NreC